MRNLLLLLTFFVTAGWGIECIAQSSTRPTKPRGKARKYLRKGRKQLSKENFELAADYLKASVKADSLTFDAPMELGYTYFHDLKKMDSSLVYFRLAERNMPKPPIDALYYFMAQAYQLTRQYDLAISYYNRFAPFIDDSTEEGIKLKTDVLRAVIDCRYARDVNQRLDSVVVTNLGTKVNTRYREHTPVVNEGDSVLMFTAKRPANKGSVDKEDGQFYEDMYISHKINGEWMEPVSTRDDPMFAKIKNTGDHEAFVFLTYDEKKLITYKKDVLWESDLIDGIYEKSLRMPPSVNIGPSQNHASITADGNTIYFSSNKPGGNGGFDIYRADKNPDGTWGEAFNLGPAVNTKGDEDSPVISPDGTILYFSSNGLIGYGDYDIFKLELGEDYNTVVNLGTPINSPGADIFYRLNQKGNHGYFASNREGGQGELDIYEVNIYKKNFANCPPIASNEYPVSLDVSKYIKTDYSNAKYIWQMGDNTDLTGHNISHTYTRPGTYFVNLNVMDSLTGKALVTDEEIPVIINNVTHIEFFAPDTAVTNEEVNFNASVSMVKNSKINRYVWDFADGTRGDSVFTSHTYNTGGYYDVKMELEAINDSTNESEIFCVSKYVLVLSGDEALAWKKANEEREALLAAKADIQPEVEAVKVVEESKPVADISLNIIYFDLDKNNIRSDAKEVLEGNIAVLKANPDVKIIVSAHTDARGKETYNKELSARRAKSVVSYLRKAGIDKTRIVSIANKGEKELVNNCGDNVECLEEQHQLNRRVELSIVKK